MEVVSPCRSIGSYFICKDNIKQSQCPFLYTMKKIKLILVKKIKTSKLLSWIRDLNILLTLSDAHTSISKETKGEKEKEKKKSIPVAIWFKL